MIAVKNVTQLAQMRRACKIAANALVAGAAQVREGATTAQIDAAIKKYILSQSAKPSFLGYDGFPASACISVNDEVIHGIPGGRKLCKGDIVSIDVGAFYGGFHGDTAATFPVGECDPEDLRLLEVTKSALSAGISAAKAGNRIGDISNAVQKVVESAGFSVVRDYVGHGVGEQLHEDPEVPNFGSPGHGPRLVEGMTIAIEPMVNAGGWEIDILDNNWTVVTTDGKHSAHFEHTVLITADGGKPLTTAH